MVNPCGEANCAWRRLTGEDQGGPFREAASLIGLSYEKLRRIDRP